MGNTWRLCRLASASWSVVGAGKRGCGRNAAPWWNDVVSRVGVLEEGIRPVGQLFLQANTV
jgi:hypothetical protein